MNIKDSTAIFRVDMGLNIGTVLWALLEFLHRSKRNLAMVPYTSKIFSMELVIMSAYTVCSPSWRFGLLLWIPRGSKYQIFQASDPKHQEWYGF